MNHIFAIDQIFSATVSRNAKDSCTFLYMKFFGGHRKYGAKIWKLKAFSYFINYLINSVILSMKPWNVSIYGMETFKLMSLWQFVERLMHV